MKRKARRKRLTRLERTAYHEAGHAVAHVLLHVPFSYATIEPEVSDARTSLGHVRSPLPDDLQEWAASAEVPSTEYRQWKRYENRILVRLSGEMAECRIAGPRRARGGVGNDHREAKKAAHAICGSKKEESAYLTWLRIRAGNIITSPTTWRCVEAVAKALLDKRKLSARRIREIIHGARKAELERKLGAKCVRDLENLGQRLKATRSDRKQADG